MRQHIVVGRSIAVLGLICLSGCASIGPDNPTQAGSIFTGKEGANTFLRESDAIRGHPARNVDLLTALDPDGYRNKREGMSWANQVAELDAAFRAFYDPRYGVADRAERRNRIQDRMVAASNESCRDYKNRLKGLQADNNIFFGALTTVLAGAGAITTAADAARALAGTAGIFSGIRAEINQGLFSTLAIEVISRAIEKARARQLQEIYKQRQQDGSYTVERAMGDAVRYHDLCSLLGGLEEASESVGASRPATTTTVGVENFDTFFRARATAAGVSPADTVFPDAENPLVQLEAALQNASNLVTLLETDAAAIKNPDAQARVAAALAQARQSRDEFQAGLANDRQRATELTQNIFKVRAELATEFAPATRAQLLTKLSGLRAEALKFIERIQLQNSALQGRIAAGRAEIEALRDLERRNVTATAPAVSTAKPQPKPEAPVTKAEPDPKP